MNTPDSRPTLPALPGSDASDPLGVPGYEVLDELARGGFGVVYRARQVAANRVVALKMILAGAHAGEEERRRFRAEVEAIARLQHPGVVQVYEVGERDGLPFFSMEFCPGGSLADHLGGAPLPPVQAARMIEAVARAVQVAHDRDLVHRDLKPANVLLTPVDGTVGEEPELASPDFCDRWVLKLADFGLARDLQQASGQTASGAIVGTPSYMAPEQAASRKDRIGPTTDVYALGAILYELLTGRPPFRGPTPVETVLQVLQDEPVPVRQLQPGVPRDLETVCDKCLQKEPGRRYGSARDLADDLARFVRGEPVTARRVGTLERGWRWCRRNPLVAGLLGAVASVLLLGTVVSTGFGLYARTAAIQAEVEAGNARRSADEAHAAEERAKDKEQEARENEQQALEQKDLAERQLMLTQLFRVASLYEREPGQAKTLLHDTSACPIHLRETAWRFYERACSRWELDALKGHHGLIGAVAFSPDGLTLASGAADRTVRLWDLKTGQTTLTLEGHTDEVTSVAFTPDGLTLASGSRDQTVRLWDVKTGQVRMTLPGHAGPVNSVVISPDGSTLASGSHDNTIRLWDMKTGRGKGVLAGHVREVTSVAFSPDGLTLASGTGDPVNIQKPGELRLWDVKTGQPRLVLSGHPGRILSVAFSPDGLTLASASFDQTVRLWDTRTGQGKIALQGHTGPVSSVAFSGDGLTLATGSQDGTVRLWDAKTGQHRVTFTGKLHVACVAFGPDGSTLASGGGDVAVRLWDTKGGQASATLQGHTQRVKSVAISPDDVTLASGSYDRTVRLWDMKTGQMKAVLPGHSHWVWSVAFSPDGLTVASGSRDQTVRLWDAKTGEPLATLRGHPGSVNSVVFSPDARTLAAGVGDPFAAEKPGEVWLWDIKTRQPRLKLRGHTEMVSCVAFSADGSTVASGSHDRTVRLWDARMGLPGVTLQMNAGLPHALAFSPDGLTLACNSSDGQGQAEIVRLWDIKTGQPRATLRGHTEKVHSVAFSPDGLTLASGALDNTVRLWDVQTGQPKAVLQGHTGWVDAVAFSADGHTLASAGMDLAIRLWDMKPGQPRAILQGHGAAVMSVALTPDGKTLASGSFDNTVRLWDVKTGRTRATLSGHTDFVLCVAFSPDGLTLASGSTDKTVRLWDVKTGRPGAVLRGHTGQVQDVAFSPDGRTLASGTEDGMVHLWDVKTGETRLTLQAHTGPVSTVAFSHDGQRVFAWGGPKGEVRAWNVGDGKETEPNNPPVTPGKWAVSPDRTWRAEATWGHEIILRDLARVDPERERAERFALEATNRLFWHQQQAERAEQNADWFAAAFHLRRVCGERPGEAELIQRHVRALARLGTRWDVLASHLAEARRLSSDAGLGFQLALAQVSAGDRDGYRNTCAELMRWSGPQGDASLAGLLLAQTPSNVGALALEARLAAGSSGLDGNRVRFMAVRACLLSPDPDILTRMLPVAERSHPILKGAVLGQLGRHDEAAAVLQSQGVPLARLHLARMEARRGNRERAATALAAALKVDRSRWPWEDQQEFELLRREVEGLLTPPRMEEVP